MRSAHAGGHNSFCQWRDNDGAFLSEQNIIVQSDDLQSYNAHREAALATAKPQTVLVETDVGYQIALNDIRGGKLPPNSVAIFDRSRNPEITINALDKNLNRVIIYHNIPENFTESKNIHGPRTFQRGYSDEELREYEPEFRDIAKKFREIGAKKIISSAEQNASAWLEKEISNYNKDDLIIIASHIVRQDIKRLNPSGDMFLYPSALLPLTDGSVYKPDIPEKTGPNVWLVGCETWDLVTQSMDIDSPTLTFSQLITYPDAFKIINQLRNGSSPRAMLHQLQMKRWRFQPPRTKSQTTPEGDHPPINPPPRGPAMVAESYEGNVLVIRTKVV